MAALRKLGSKFQLNSTYNPLEPARVPTTDSGYSSVAKDGSVSPASTPSGSPQKSPKLSKAKSMNFSSILNSFTDSIRWSTSLLRTNTDDLSSSSPDSTAYKTPQKNRSLRNRMSSSRSRSSKKSLWSSRRRRATILAYERDQLQSPIHKRSSSSGRETADALMVEISTSSLNQSVAELTMSSEEAQGSSPRSKALIGPQLLWPGPLDRSQGTNDPYVEEATSASGIEAAELSGDLLEADHESGLIKNEKLAQTFSASPVCSQQQENPCQNVPNEVASSVDDRHSLPSYRTHFAGSEIDSAEFAKSQVPGSNASTSADYKLRRMLSRRSGLRNGDSSTEDRSELVIDDGSFAVEDGTAQERKNSMSPTAAPSMGSRASWESSRAERARRYADIVTYDKEHLSPSQSSSEIDPDIEDSPLRYAVEAIKRKTSFQLEDEITDCRPLAVDGINKDIGTQLLEKARDQAKRANLAVIEEFHGHQYSTLPQSNPLGTGNSKEVANFAEQSIDENERMEYLRLSSASPTETPTGRDLSMISQNENFSIFLGELECHSSDINPRSSRLHFSIAEQNPLESAKDMNKAMNAIPPNRPFERSECCTVTLQIGLHNCGCYPSSLSTDFIQHADNDQCCTRTQQLGYHTCGCHPVAVGDFELLQSVAQVTSLSGDENSKSTPKSETSAYQRFIARIEAEMNKENAVTGSRIGKKKLYELRGEARRQRERKRAKINGWGNDSSPVL